MGQYNIRKVNPPFVRVIAIVGCDGSGKSTLAMALLEKLAPKMPTQLLYLGQSSGRIGEWISQLPIIGAPFGRYLRAKAAKVHDFPSQPPGNVSALVIFFTLLLAGLEVSQNAAPKRARICIDNRPLSAGGSARFSL